MPDMRKRSVFINIMFSLLLEGFTVFSSFIIPRLIIQSYGSAANGLVNSVASFIGYISVLQLGVGSVIKSSMYRPLAMHDKSTIDSIVRTTERFFSKIGVASFAYIVLLAFIYPMGFEKDFSYLYTMSLILIVGVGTVAQYLFGITYQMLLEADQKSYVYSSVQIIAIIINVVSAVICVQAGCSLHVVKLVSSLIFTVRPIAIGLYARKKYKIAKHAVIDNSLIKQRWDGFSQGIAYFIHSKTDIFVLTVFSTFENISIYSVYALVSAGLTAVINCIDKAVRAAFGNIFASDQNEQLKKSFHAYNTLIHLFVTAVFVTAAITIDAFIQVYTADVHDINYVQPLFGTLVMIAEMVYCLRMPYNGIIFIAGRFKETKRSAYIEAILNIVISVALVKPLGLIGVAAGTLAAMSFRTVSFIIYLHQHLLMLEYRYQAKRFLITGLSFAIAFFSFSAYKADVQGFAGWFIYAAVIFLLSGMVILAVNLLFDRATAVQAFKLLLNKKMPKSGRKR